MKSYSAQTYDANKYDFVKIIRDLFGVELENINTLSDKTYAIFEIGKDSSTDFHKKFYDKYHEGWEELQNTYDLFIKEVVSKDFNEDILYQKFPTFRVHLPKNVAVGAFHNDSEFQHPVGEVNYILPLTNSENTQSVWVESEPSKKDFAPMKLRVGELVRFNGNRLTHGNKINSTKKTRVSMDFRILPISHYDKSRIGESITLHTKFKEGAYYKRLNKEMMSDKDYDFIFSKTPRVCVDLLIKTEHGILLTKRTNEPNKDLYQLTGGGVRFRESLNDAIIRICEQELGNTPKNIKFIDKLEFLNEETKGEARHSVSLVFQVKLSTSNIVLDNNSSEYLYFNNDIDSALIIPEHLEIIKKHGEN